jgi:hypothetical protein
MNPRLIENDQKMGELCVMQTWLDDADFLPLI